MAAAVFALVGTALGVLGALAVQVTQARSDDLRARREALRLACAEFTAAIARMRNLAIELVREPADAARMESLRDAHPGDVYQEPDEWLGPPVPGVTLQGPDPREQRQ